MIQSGITYYDVLGVGFGPSNLALAIALQETGLPLSAHFIDAGRGEWQPGMLLDRSDIQNNPLRDLVTPRNPMSRYTFVNYLKEVGRLFDYLNLGLEYPLRKDYAKYVNWVAQHFHHLVSYGECVQHLEPDDEHQRWVVQTDRRRLTAGALVIGTGRSRNIPEIFADHIGSRVFHLSDYLPKTQALGRDLQSVAVVGSSQSAVEIHLDLMNRFPDAGIHAVHRSFSMRQKDTSPFSDHVYFPEFVDYFHAAHPLARSELRRQLRATNYSAADLDVLKELYLRIYEERLDERNRFHIHNNSMVDRVETGKTGVQLCLRDRFFNKCETLAVDAVVLATGFKDIGTGEGEEPVPPLLSDLTSLLALSSDGALTISRDYRVSARFPMPLFLNGLCESSHGFGDAGSFSLISLRASEILKGLNAGLQACRPRPDSVRVA